MPLLNAIPMPVQPPTDMRLRLAASLPSSIERAMWIFAWELDIPAETLRTNTKRHPRRKKLARYVYDWANQHGHRISWPGVASMVGVRSHATLVAAAKKARRTTR